MRNDFFAHLEKLPLSYFQAHRTGDLMSRATNDLNAVRMMIGPSVMYSANTLLAFVVALALMISIDARLTLFSLIPLPFVSLSVKYLRQRHPQAVRADPGAAVGGQRRRPGSARPASASCARTVRKQAELDRFRRANVEYLRRNRRLIALQGFFFPSMAFFLGLGSMLVLWLGQPRRDRRPDHPRRVRRVQRLPDDAGLADDCLRLGDEHAPARHGELEADARGAGHRAGDRDDRRRRDRRTPKHERRRRSCASPDARIRGEIEFRDLAFSYNGTPVLDHVSARIEAGQTVALVGVTGSGKSTLISLLARLHDPPPGHGVRRRRRRARPSRSRCSAARSGSCRRSRFCSPTRSPTTWPSARRRGRSARQRPESPSGIVEAGGGRRAARQGRRRLPEGLRHAGRRARHHAVGRPEAAHRHRPRHRRSIRASSSSTMRCRRWTPTPRRRSCRGCAA